MDCCPHCRDAGTFFGARTAARDLRRYRRRGPLPSTRLLVDLIPPEDIRGSTLLDVGGGVGAVQHELLDRGLASATHVDASPAYLEAARNEAERRGTGDRVSRLYGDFVDLAPGLPAADLVTLDRVICCYPDAERMLDAALSRTGRLLGLVYPRARFGAGTVLKAANLWCRLTRSAFRVHLHPPARIRARIESQGFASIGTARTFFWEVGVWRRSGAHPPGAVPST